jgi:toxin YhaV
MRRSKATSSSEGSSPPPGGELLTVNGWRIGFHPALLLQLERLIRAAEEDSRRNPDRRNASQPALILAGLRKLIFEDVPANPASAAFRQGGTLGPHRKHWFRAKFGNGRYRLFFRYRTSDRILLFAWVNDERSLRTYGSATDAYATFRRMLDDDNPPDDWSALLRTCSTPETVRRLQTMLTLIRDPDGR